VSDLLRFAVSRFNQANLFFGHGTTTLRRGAYLILHTLAPAARPIGTISRCTPAAGGNRFRGGNIAPGRVEERLPAAYLTHEAWLGDLHFYVDERVIVPRSFIAELLREHLQPWVRTLKPSPAAWTCAPVRDVSPS